MSNSGESDLARMIARLRALPQMLERSAPEIADALADELRRTIGAGQGPDGTPWRPTKTGSTTLTNAHRALTVRAIGTVILARLEGHHARHHIGAVRGSSKTDWLARPMLPNAKITKPIATAIRTKLEREFTRTMKRGRS